MSAPQPGRSGWATVALLCGCAVISALLELLFVPLYVGSVLVPVVVVAALVGNVVLPRWGFAATGRAAGAVLPVLCWLVVVLGLTMYQRPEGDIFVLGGNAQQWAFYALLLVGAAAGFATIVVSAGAVPPSVRPPLPTRPQPTRSRPAPKPPARGNGKRPPISR
jgi:hypothetical protein